MKVLGAVLMLLVFCSGVYAVTPEETTIERHKRPDAKGYICLISEDEFVTVCYDEDVTSVPPVERYALLYEHVDQHFENVGRGDSVPLVIYIHKYKRFVSRLYGMYPPAAVAMRQGQSIFYAFTYGAKEEAMLVIETYQPLDDNTLIHELLHHYLDSVVKDGSLNHHLIINDYSHHIESLFRQTLEKEF